VTDPLVTVVGGPTTLDVGECDNTTFTGVYYITQADIDAGYVYNMATADSDESGPDGDDATVPLPSNPAYTIDKTVVDVDCEGPLGQVDEAGDVITYQVVVTNTGNVALTGVTLEDSLVAVVGDAVESMDDDDVLQVGETWTWTYTYAATQQDIDSHGGCDGDIDNTATVDSDQLGPEEDSAEVPICAPPDISVTKTASASSVPETGAWVDFTFVVTNHGNVAVTLTSLNDSVFGELLCGPVTIAAHDSFTLTISRWIACHLVAVAAGGQVAGCPPRCVDHYNVVTAIARDRAGNTDTATDDETVTFTDVKPEISVTKTASVCSVPASGAWVDFTFVVTNHSAELVVLTSLKDSVFGQLLCGLVDIPAGEHFTLVISRWIACDSAVPTDGGQTGCCPLPCTYHYNVVTATVWDNERSTATASDDETVIFTGVADGCQSDEVEETSAPEANAPEDAGDLDAGDIGDTNGAPADRTGGANDPQASADAEGDAGGSAVPADGPAAPTGGEEPAGADEAADLAATDPQSGPNRLLYLLALLVLPLAIFGWLMQRRQSG
jgi:hypothetical protein